eukprot:TRINITY_DN4917_c0_g2_i2.p1 TRINITY_DN4917_c0_g2~~TRINITY_DN4917_c0_g2_i2.p1  ORF type:complete len:365 (+),score=79.94 TRINITY_DN4917_c0_g2_i2:96-1097(+)
MLRSLVGSEMCIRDSINAEYGGLGVCTMMATFWVAISALLACAVDCAGVVRESTILCPERATRLPQVQDPQRLSSVLAAGSQTGLGRQTRFSIKNPSPNVVALVYWVNRRDGTEVLKLEVGPGQQSRVTTFMGDTFIVRDGRTGAPLLQHTVGFYAVKLDPGVNCTGISQRVEYGMPITGPLPALQGPRPLKRVGAFRASHSRLGLVNLHPCDIVVSWVYPKFHPSGKCGERWTSDLRMGTTPHLENTRDGHEFRFRLPDGTLVDSYTVRPLVIPRCDGEQTTTAKITQVGAGVLVGARLKANSTGSTNATMPGSEAGGVMFTFSQKFEAATR